MEREEVAERARRGGRALGRGVVSVGVGAVGLWRWARENGWIVIGEKEYHGSYEEWEAAMQEASQPRPREPIRDYKYPR